MMGKLNGSNGTASTDSEKVEFSFEWVQEMRKMIKDSCLPKAPPWANALTFHGFKIIRNSCVPENTIIVRSRMFDQLYEKSDGREE